MVGRLLVGCGRCVACTIIQLLCLWGSGDRGGTGRAGCGKGGLVGGGSAMVYVYCF
jgi:hypothetical protein